MKKEKKYIRGAHVCLAGLSLESCDNLTTYLSLYEVQLKLAAGL